MHTEKDVELARRGDREAFSRLIRAAETELYGVARSIVRSDEDCADALQETILKAYRALPKLRQPAYFKTWLIRILINECNRILRRRRRVVPAAGDDYRNVELHDAVERLEEGLQLVVQLHYFRDMPVSEISSLLDTPEGTVKSRLHRARLLLAQWLGSPNERKIGYDPC